MPTPAALFGTGLVSTTAYPFTITIDGRSVANTLLDYPSIELQDVAIGDSGTFAFRLWDASSNVAIRDEALVRVYDDTINQVIFLGTIRKRDYDAQGVGRWIVLEAVSVNSLLDRLLVPFEDRPVESTGARFGYLWGLYAKAPLSPDLTYVVNVNASLAADTFQNITLRQALQQIADQSGSSVRFYVDTTGRPHLFSGTESTPGAAPYNLNLALAPGGGNIAPTSLSVERDGNIRNRVFVVAAIPGASGWYQDDGSVDAYGPRETYVNAPSADTIAKARNVAQLYLGRMAEPRVRGKFTTESPYDGWRAGQNITVTSAQHDLTAEAHRIVRVTHNFQTGTGKRVYTVEFGDTIGSTGTADFGDSPTITQVSNVGQDTLEGRDVRQDGAFGDGTTNDTAAIQTTINKVAADNGGIVQFPNGTFLVTSPLLIPGNDITMAGAQNTVIVYTGSGAVIRNSDTSQIRRRFTLRNLSIRNSTTGSAGGVKLENFYQGVIEHVNFENVGPTGIGVEMVGTGSTYFNIIRGCYFTCIKSGTAGTGVKLTAGAGAPNANSILDSVFNIGDSGIGIDVASGGQTVIDGTAITGATGTGYNLILRATATQFNRITNCRFEDGAVSLAAPQTYLFGNSYATTSTPTDTSTDSAWADDRYFAIAGSCAFDSTQPGFVYFTIPSFSGYTFQIPRARLNTHFREFWAPATDASSGGGSTSGASSSSSSGASSTSTSGAGAHSHLVGQYNAAGPGAYTNRRYDGASINFNLETSSAADLSTLNEDAGGGSGHDHGMAHTHDIAHTHSTPNHSHNLTYGVFEETYPASHSVDILVQRFSAGVWSTVQTIANITADSDLDRDISSGITVAGEYRLRLLSDAAQPNGGRLVADLSGFVAVRLTG